MKPTPAAVTTRELVALTGETAAELRRWREHGLLPRVDDHDLWERDDADRVELIRFVLARGIDLDELASLVREHGDILGRFVGYLGGASRPVGAGLDEVARDLGLDVEFARRIWRAGRRGDEHQVSEDDTDALRAVSMALDAGVPGEALIQLVRVYSDALCRVAEAESRLFHDHVHERLRSEGLRAAELLEATGAASRPLLAVLEPTILYFHRLGWRRALREDLLVHLFENTRDAEPTAPGEIALTIVFVDLARFTALTDAMGDAAAAEVVMRFAEMVRAIVDRHHGKVVKQIGDAFMLVFPRAGAAVESALAMQDRAAIEPHFPAIRIGIHSGTVLYREADYVGLDVSIASRVADRAAAGEVLVTEATRADAAEVDGVQFDPVGTHQLKGVATSFELFAARPTQQRRSRPHDPVCGMQLDPATAAARLAWHGYEFSFCSQACLQRFVDSPEHYTA